MTDKLTVGSLFAGIGGIELGLERTGHFETVWQVEIDDYAARVLERHWPGARRWRDITTFPPNANGSGGEQPGTQPAHRLTDKQAEAWSVDLICGGFPCQDISYAGKGAGLSGERSGLFFEAARVIGELGPRYVLLENVAALLGRGLGEVLGTLASLGYDAEWHCIPAAAVGAPHIRDRVFVVAYTTNSNDATSGDKKRWTQAQPRNIRRRGGERRYTTTISDGFHANGERPGQRLYGMHNSADIRQGSSKENVSHTSQQGLPQSEQADVQRAGRREEGRAATECDWWSTQCRLGIHPDGVSGGLDCGGWECGIPRTAKGQKDRVSRLRCLGNAVVPQVAEFIGHCIWQHHQAGAE